MTDNNIKFKIKSYIEILKYTENKDERERILSIVNEYLENYEDYTSRIIDGVESFLNDCVIYEPKSRIKRISLFEEYEDYCREQNCTPLKKKGFYQSMRARGYSEVKTNGDNCFKDIAFCRYMKGESE